MSENRLEEISEYKKRREALKGNRSVKRPIARIDKGVLKGGRKRKYTPTRMRNEINKYFQHCEENDEIPNIKGMCIYLNLYRNSFYKYMEVPEYTDLLEHARMIIAEWTESDVYNTSGQAAGKIAYMKNLHGWSDRLETNNTTEVKQVVSVEDARAKLESLAPQLLEILKNKTTVDQIASKEIVDAEILEDKKA